MMILLTTVIALSTVGQMVQSCNNNRSTSTQVDRLIVAADRIDEAADSFSRSAAGINSGIGDAVGKLNEQAEATKQAAIAGGKQADAAKVLADETAKQLESNQALIDSQRASLSISLGNVKNPVTFHDGGVSTVFSIFLQNTGALEATHVSIRFKPYYSLAGRLQMFTEPLQEQRDYCAAPLPPDQPWDWDEKGQRINIEGLRDWTVTVPPHTAFERELNFSMRKPADSEIIKWPPPDIIQRNPSLTITDRINPIVVGCVDYQSGAMPEKHQTGFIFEVQEAYPGTAVPTFVHYGVDVPRERVVITQFYFGQGKKY